MSTVLEQFFASQDVKPSSRALYQRTFRAYEKWLKANNFTLLQVSPATIVQYKEYLLVRGLSALTVGAYLSVVRKFYQWISQEGHGTNVAKGLRSPKRRQQFRKYPLSSDQANKLLQYIANKSIRDFALVNLLIRTGIRTIEAARANIGDITFKGDKRVLLVQGKGRDEKDNFVVLTSKTFAPLAAYLSTRQPQIAGEPLFISESPNAHHQRLTTRSMSSIVKQALRAIGLDAKEFTAHSLRHTTAVNILRAGGSLQDAQGVLRHSNPATTQIYTAIIEEEMRLENSAEELIDSIL